MNIIHKLTRKMLAGNRTRTLVTVIGIMLSVAMFTAVMSMVSSMQDYLLRFEESRRGLWEGALRCRTVEEFEAYRLEGNVKSYTRIQQQELALNPSNYGEKYVSVVGLDGNFSPLLKLELLEGGRMPENGNELVLSERILDEKGFSYQVGDTITLTLGTRELNGEALANQERSSDEEETFRAGPQKTYTVVGICARPSFEDQLFPGYTAITAAKEDFTGVSDYFFTVHNAKRLVQDEQSDLGVEVNHELLRFQGRNPNDPSMRVLYGMAAILIGIISLGAISLIYNAFSISVSQRTRQFGILKSIGATNRQIRGSVFYEAMLLSAIGIPLGIGVGIAGIGITLRLLRDKIALFFTGNEGVEMRLKVSVEAVLISAAIGLITVLISAWIPATRAMRGNAIDAIRQTADVKIKAKKVRTPRWIYRVFGFEGMIADKNFKRNRRQYRATVLSLLLSIFLFISTSSFCAYLTESVDRVAEVSSPDIIFMMRSESMEKTTSILRKLDNLSTVEECNYFCAAEGTVDLPEDALTGGFKKIMNESGEQIQLRLALMEDSCFEAWLRKNNVDLPKGQAVMLKTFRYYNPETERYEVPDILKKTGVTASVFIAPQYTSKGKMTNWDKDGEVDVVTYRDFETEKETVIRSDDPAQRREFTVGAVIADTPLALDSRVLTLVLPASEWLETLEMDRADGIYGVRTHSARAAEAEIRELLNDEMAQMIYLSNIAESNDSQEALVTVVNVFSYGFIILISLIALTNVFNTINTNVILRRREFAMLRSVGLTRRGTDRMMIFECLLYGFKSLLYGLPLSIIATALIWRAISRGVSMRFYLPGSSIAIAVGSVFLVVFATMLYSMRKIRKENPIDAMKSEIL